jgi:signal transduction histidine kinase
VLSARSAGLAAAGPLAALVPPLAYPDPRAAPAPAALAASPEAAAWFEAPQTLCYPLDPERHGGFVWAVPLWSEHGPVGLLLLGDKVDGGLYTQEEIEIARAGGERLIDTRASAEMAQRLMALQRQRLAESQVIEGRARRVLHDDVLPELHAALLALPGNGGAARPADLLQSAHRRIASLLREMPGAAAPAVARLGLFGALRQAVEDELGEAFEEVAWAIEPGAESQARGLPPLTAETLFFAAREAARNAARHARAAGGPRPRLRVMAEWDGGLVVRLEDDGPAAPASGANGGSGQGLALHGTLMAVVGGSLAAEPTASGMRVTVRLPAA